MDPRAHDQDPLVSIVITSYNRAHFIGQAIESALAQDYPNLEIIISDNYSTDNTGEVIKRYTHDPRIKYFINASNIGMIPNFIRATYELAKGKYISFLSSDDYLVNHTFISEAVKRINLYPGIHVVTGIIVAEVTRYKHLFQAKPYTFYKDSFYKMPFVPGKAVFLQFPDCPSMSYAGTLMNREGLVKLDASVYAPVSFDMQHILQLLLTGDAAFIEKDTYVARIHGENATSGVTKAQVHINNLVYIDIAYQDALKNKRFDQAVLEKWKADMLFHICLSCLRYHYRQGRKEYQLFAAYVKKQYPAVYKRIRETREWKLYYFVFAIPPLGKTLVHIKNYLGQLKRTVKKEKTKVQTSY